MKQNFQELLRSLSSTDNGGDPNAKLKSFMSFLSGVNGADAQEQQMQQNPELAEQAQDGNVVIGGAGGDQIAQAQQQPQSFNDILNNTAAGKGNLDYDAFRKNYPTPRESSAPATNQDAYDYMMSQGKDGESAGMTIGKAMAYQNAQKAAREGARNTALDARDLAAYNAAFGLAKESGTRQDEAGKLASEDAYRKAQIGMMPSEIALRNAQAAYYERDRGKGAGGEKQAKPLPAGAAVQGLNYLHYLTGQTDDKGKSIDGAADPIDKTHEQALLDYASKGVRSGAFDSIQQGIDEGIDAAGGLGALASPDKHFWNPFKSAEPRQFPNIGNIQQQRAALSGAAKNIAGGGEEIPTGGNIGGGIKDGTTATNPKTGRKMVFRGGLWSPM